MGCSMTLTISNESGRELSLVPLTAASSGWQIAPPDKIGSNSVVQLRPNGGSQLCAQVWYGDGMDQPYGISVILSDGTIAGLSCQYAEVTSQEKLGDEVRVDVTFPSPETADEAKDLEAPANRASDAEQQAQGAQPEPKDVEAAGHAGPQVPAPTEAEAQEEVPPRGEGSTGTAT